MSATAKTKFTNERSPAFPMAFSEDESGSVGMTLREYMVTRFVAALIVARGTDVGNPEAMVKNAFHFVDLTLQGIEEKW